MPEEDDFKPRNYQVALREIAMKNNSIIYLPTGSGKTFIAVLVLKSLSGSLTQPYSSGGKISFIIVNSVPLVDQHAKCIEKRTTLNVGRYSGEMLVDSWNKDRWYQEFNTHQVFIMTAQILLNLTNQNFIDLNKVNLIVFDECHRGVSDQPMRRLCMSFEALAEPPRVLGLTATLLNGNCLPSKVKENVEDLETTFHSKVATVDGLGEVTGYSTNPKERLVIFEAHKLSHIESIAVARLEDVKALIENVNKSKEYSPPRSCLTPLDKPDYLKKLRNLVEDTILHINTLGLFGGGLCLLAHIIQLERLKKHCSDSKMLVIFSYVETTFSHIKKMFDVVLPDGCDVDDILIHSSDQVRQLIDIFDKHKDLSSEEICALIFVKRRFTAKVIYYIINYLSTHSSQYAYIKSNFIVGYNNNPYNDTREALYISKKNKEILLSFENKEINVLVASNVLEEGVDIPTCSLVIKFDPPEEYRSYIQSKGRARNPSSIYYMLVDSMHYKKFKSRYTEFQAIEKILQDFLIGQNKNREGPSEADINKMYNEDILAPYYVDGLNSAKVDATSAISLLCAYCSCQQSDKYTDLTPEWYKTEKHTATLEKKVCVTVILPKGCPLIGSITGPYMSNLKLAKRAVALKVCEMLHKHGELDNNLVPVRSKVVEADIQFLFRHYPQEKEQLAGTNKKKRMCKKEIPYCLRGGIQPGQNVYLHIIRFTPEFDRTEQLNTSTFYDMYSSDLCYGIITPQRVSEICNFPVYVSNGTLNVDIQINVAHLSFTEAELNGIRKFHFTVLNDILEALRGFFIFDNGEDAETMLLVPINKNSGSIITDLLTQPIDIKEPYTELTTDEKTNLDITQQSYLHHIVSPWYANMGHYIVIEVTFRKTAESQFPNEAFASYADYYLKKYELSLLRRDLPLLFVKSLTSRTNFMKPYGLESKKKRDKHFEELEIHLMPELVVKQDFPGALWIQASLLPTVLFRLSYLLRLEDFRRKIAIESGLGTEQVQGHNPPLELDRYLLNYEPIIKKPKSATDKLVLEEKVNVPTTLSLNPNKDYARKMLENEFPWKDSEEPKDVERNLDVTIVDIDYYETFISKSVKPADVLQKNNSPTLRKQQLALTYTKDYIERPIQLLKKKDLSKGPSLSLLYKAMTTAKANDIVNMERLETLGDSFLKFMSSIYIYLKYPQFKEGDATELKGRLVSNKNLYYLGRLKNIGGIMKNNDLQIADWLPPSFKLPELMVKRINSKDMSLASIYHFCFPLDEQRTGDLSPDSLLQISNEASPDDPSQEGLINQVAPFFKSNFVGDKTVADCVEALLGAYFQCTGIQGGIKFMEWMNIIPPSEKLNMILKKEVRSFINDKIPSVRDIEVHIPMWKKMEEVLGYHFRDMRYLLQALTHASYTPNQHTQSYERLEFLGDAILDFLITCHIYEISDKLDPGQLTDLRSALVNNNTFASLVVRCNFHKHFLFINNKLQTAIDRFADFIESRNFQIDDEVLILLEENEGGLKLAENVDVPKALGDIFEALAGAIYLDSGRDLNTVWKIFHRIMWKEIEAFSANIPKNLVRRLYEWSPNAHPVFGNTVDLENEKVMVPLHFMLNGRKQEVFGFGSNKILAKKAAAKLALRQLDSAI